MRFLGSRGSRGGQRRWPTGRAEVELFTFWERDLAADRSQPRDGEPTMRMAAHHYTVTSSAHTSLAPLWWSMGIAALVVLLAALA